MRPNEPKLDRDGFPIPPGFGEAGMEDPTRSGGETSRRIRFVLRMALLAALVTVVWHHFDVGRKACDFLGRYFGQEAIKLYRKNDLPRALAAADRAVGWSPDNAELLLIRCQLKLVNKDPQGCLVDVERAVALAPQDNHAHDLRQHVYHLLAKHREAAAAAGELLARGLGDRAALLNSRAYSRAQGDFELEEALTDINEALKSAGEDNAAFAAFLDTRGYILLKLGKHKEALVDLQKAIDLVEAQRREIQGFGQGRELLGQLGRDFGSQMTKLEHDLAVMIHHRGEVHEKLAEQKQTETEKQAQKELAEKDFRLAERYGFNPAEGVY